MNYYEHHIGDYDADTAHLSWVEDMAYTRLLRLFYRRERPIPVDVAEACRLVRATTREQKQAVAAVLKEFFELQDDGWHQARCDEEIERYQRRVDHNQRVGRLGGRPKKEKPKQNPPGSFREPEQNPLQTPVSRPQSPVNTLEGGGYSPSPVGDGLPPDPDPADQDPETKPPPCPHVAVLKLWAEVLPAMPQHDPEQWHDVRRKHLQTRWRETAVAKGWKTQEEGLAFFRRLFGYVGKSAFLTGRGKADPNRPPFVIELEWLILPANWAKVIEGKYHPET